jgi:hypothetical protein
MPLTAMQNVKVDYVVPAEEIGEIVTEWSALRAIEESIELRTRMADRAEIRTLTAMLPGLRRDIDDAERRADALRALLLEPQGSSSESAVAPAKTRRNDGKKKGR